MGNEGVEYPKQTKDTIDSVKEKIEALRTQQYELQLKIIEKIKWLDENCGADQQSIKDLRKEVIASKAENMDADNGWAYAEEEDERLHIFDLLEMHGEHNEELAAKIEADIAGHKLLRGEL
jgi:hypothetical protein